MTSHRDRLLHGTNAVVRERLERAVATQRLHASLLFFGPPGSGREATARWLAARLLCTGSGPAPCGDCPACGRISRDVHPDVRFCRPASRSRRVVIEDVRQIQEEMSFRPFEANRRLFAVFEAERMTEQAANAFLKTLEEPPADTVLVLTAPAPGSMLPTVQSRCQPVHFPLLPLEEQARGLATRGEDWSAEDALVCLRLLGGDPVAAAQQGVEEVQQERDALLRLLQRFVSEPGTAIDVLGWVEERFTAPKRDEDGLPLEPDRLLRALTLLRTIARDVLCVATASATPLANRDAERAIREMASRLGPAGAADLLSRVEETRRFLDRGANRRLAAEDLFLSVQERLATSS